MKEHLKKLYVVTAGSLGVTVAITIIVMTLSFPLGIEKQVDDILFGEWRIELRLAVSAIAFPFLWRYMKVGVK